MAVTTLKNTTWKFGEYLLSDYTTAFSYAISFSVKLHFNNTVYSTSLNCTPFSLENSGGTISFPKTSISMNDENSATTSNTSSLYYGYNKQPRILSNYRTNFEGVYITFLDGTDIDNPNAIAWVQANATQIIEEPPSGDEDEPTEPIPNLITLVGITVKPNDFPIQEVVGILPDNPYSLNIEINGITYNTFSFIEDAIYLSNDNGDSLEILNTDYELKIVGGADATNPNMINFIRTNFNVVSDFGATITYKGVETTVQAGLTVALKYANKKITDDIVIAFTENGVITYKGVETTVQAGQTATLKCNGKKMTDDLYLELKKVEDEPIIQTYKLILYSGIKAENLTTGEIIQVGLNSSDNYPTTYTVKTGELIKLTSVNSSYRYVTGTKQLPSGSSESTPISYTIDNLPTYFNMSKGSGNISAFYFKVVAS